MLSTIGLLLATHRSVPPYVIARRHQLTHDRICSASDNKISVWLPHDGGLRPLRTAMCRGAKPELRWLSGRSGSAGEVRPSRARQKSSNEPRQTTARSGWTPWVSPSTHSVYASLAARALLSYQRQPGDPLSSRLSTLHSRVYRVNTFRRHASLVLAICQAQ